MQPFDPLRDVENSRSILETAGNWPDFHDAMIHNISFDRGDMRPDDNVWIGPIIQARIELKRFAFDVNRSPPRPISPRRRPGP